MPEPIVTSPWTVADALEPRDWESVRLRAMFDCCKWDIQCEDHSVLADFPLVLEEQAWRSLASHAEKLAREVLAAEREIVCRLDLHAAIGLPNGIRRAFRTGRCEDVPAGSARVMRFDFHFTTAGWQISEVNADVPGGFIESSGFVELMAAYYPEYATPPNPATAYAAAITAAAGDNAAVALVHATAHSDDRQVMEYLARDLQRRCVKTIVLSPRHLTWESGFARVSSSFDAAKPDLLVRFFPAEWLPNLRPASTWEPWFRGGKTPMSNPGSAVVTQSKRFPLVWRELTTPLPGLLSLLPESRCPSELPPGSEDWVFKPAFGRAGEGVAIAGISEGAAYQQTVKEAMRHPHDWVAQRRFEAVPVQTRDGARYACLGVFTLDGRAVGAYGRIATRPLIDYDAQDIAVLIGRSETRRA